MIDVKQNEILLLKKENFIKKIINILISLNNYIRNILLIKSTRNRDVFLQQIVINKIYVAQRGEIGRGEKYLPSPRGRDGVS